MNAGTAGTGGDAPVETALHHYGHAKQSLAKLALGAVGVVYGDIGTSPLYAVKEVFVGHHKLAVDQLHVLGVISLMFWSLMLIVTLKYIIADPARRQQWRGRQSGAAGADPAQDRRRALGAEPRHPGRARDRVVLRRLHDHAGDLGAVGGRGAGDGRGGLRQLGRAARRSAILVGLFWIQSVGTAKVGRLFGPIMLVYFVTLAVLGVIKILDRPDVLMAINPIWAVRFCDRRTVRWRSWRSAPSCCA